VRLFILLIAVAACGGSSETPHDSGPHDAGVGVDAPPPRFCVLACTDASECAFGQPGSTFDVDNYSCRDGACVWHGCLSTAECTTTFGMSGYSCEAAFGETRPRCWETCSGPADCGPLDECADGKCHRVGCSSTAHCTQIFGAGQVCQDRECRDTCATPADCAGKSQPPPNEADNYECVQGACVWLGCGPTGCDSLLGGPYTCAP
jgi:hypothetical protein